MGRGSDGGERTPGVLKAVVAADHERMGDALEIVEESMDRGRIVREALEQAGVCADWTAGINAKDEGLRGRYSHGLSSGCDGMWSECDVLRRNCGISLFSYANFC